MPSATESDRSPAAPAGSTIRVYGRSVPKPDLPESEVVENPRLTIIYCGFRAGDNDVRIPTGRVFHIPRGDIGATGVMSDYVVGGEAVQYYDVGIAADVQETRSSPVSLGAEMVMSTGGTFASLAATPPDRAHGYPEI